MKHCRQPGSGSEPILITNLIIKEHGNSRQSVGLVAGIPVMNKDKIQPMCVSAADELFKELEGSLAKVVKKSAKKL